MTKIIAFEGVHGVGKGTLINEYIQNEPRKVKVIRDSEFPKFEESKKKIRSGLVSNPSEIVELIAETRESVYRHNIIPLLGDLEVAILDRSYYSSAVWQSFSYSEMYEILDLNESKQIPKADRTVILYAPIKKVVDRLYSRNREDLDSIDLGRLNDEQEKFLHLCYYRKECIPFLNMGDPTQLGRRLYELLN